MTCESKFLNRRTLAKIERLRARFIDGKCDRRQFLQALLSLGLSTAAVSSIFGQAAWAKNENGTGSGGEQIWDGKVFDAKGESVTIAHFGGELQDLATSAFLKDFEREFNCRVIYDADWLWFTKMSLGGANNPPIDLYNGDFPEVFNLGARGFFVSHEDIRANVPAVSEMMQEVAFYGPGIIWALHVMGIAYRTDMVQEAPQSLLDFWKAKFADRKAIYRQGNQLQAMLFMSLSQAFGKDQYDTEVAFKMFEEGKPWIISPFTGETMNLMERGEVVIAWQTDGEALLQKQRGLPIDWVRPKELATFNPMYSAIAKGSSNTKKKLAYALLDRYCSVEAAKVWTQGLFFHSLNLRATLAPELESLGFTSPREDLASLFMPDWRWYTDHEPQIIDRMNTILAN